jgi:hypothetical protein
MYDFDRRTLEAERIMLRSWEAMDHHNERVRVAIAFHCESISEKERVIAEHEAAIAERGEL